MIVDVIGTSCTWFERNNTSFVIDKSIILDTPNGSYKNIIKVMDFFKAEAILISHLHSDHFQDLHCFTTQILRWAKKQGRTEKLRIYGPKGMLDALTKIMELTSASVEETKKEMYYDTMEFIDLYDGQVIELKDYSVEVCRMMHGRTESYGFIFKDKNNQKVSFSCDTSMCENLEKMLSSSKYAFVDTALQTGLRNDRHLSIDEFMELEKKYDGCKMFPVHTCDENQEKAIDLGLNYLIDGEVVELK